MTSTSLQSATSLPAARRPDARGRTPFAGPAFSMLNAAGGAAPSSTAADLTVAVRPETMLAELDTLGAAPRLAAALHGLRRGIDEQQQQEAADAQQDTQRRQLQVQARKLVSQTFFGAMFRQMRNSPFKSEVFEGGRGGQVFASMLDQHLSEQMSRGVGDKLVNTLVRRLEGHHRTRRAGHELHQRALLPQPVNPYENVRAHVTPAQ